MNNGKDYLHKDTDRIYYDVDMRWDQGQPSPTGLNYAEFRIERTIPILDRPKDYYLTISRFTVPVLDTPLLMCPIAGTGYVGVGPPPPAIDVTPFTVTLTYSGTDFQQTLVWVTRNPTAPVPTTPGAIDVYHPYYYAMYTYDHFVEMVNIAFTNAFNSLKASFPGAPPTEAPYIIYNPETELFSLVCQYLYVGAGTIDIFVNDELLTYLGNIDGTFHGRNTTAGKDFEFTIIDNDNGYAKPGGTIPIPPLNPTYLQFEQEYPSLDVFNSFFDLIFTTGTLPIVREWTQTNDPQNLEPTQISLITDFQPLLSEAGDIRSAIAYYPSGPYRLINLTGNTPLRNFDIKLWWKDKQGRLYPLTIPYKQTVSIKFLFIKKSTFTS